MSLQGRENAARVDREGTTAKSLHAPAERIGEQRVGAFRLGIGDPFLIFAMLELDIVPQYAVALVGNRRQRHHSRCFRLFEQGHQRPGQCEMAHMVDPELAFPAGSDPVQRAGHDAGIVDQQVERIDTIIDRGGKGADRIEIGEIHFGRGHVAFDRRQIFLRLGRIAHRHDHRGPGIGQRPGGFQPDAGIAAGDDRGPAGQVDAGEDFVRFALGVKARAERFLVCCCHCLNPFSCR